MTKEARERTKRMNKVRYYDSVVGMNDKAREKKKNDERFQKAYEEFKRPPYGMEGARNG